MMGRTNVNIYINNNKLQKYFHRTHNSIHKLLYLIEEDNKDLELNINNLILELISGDEILWENDYFVQLIFNIQGLKYKMHNYKDFKSHIFKCENICDSIAEKLKGG